MKSYIGKIQDHGVGGQPVIVNHQMSSSSSLDYPLSHIERHSPDGFNWGYCGSGPSDLALSILTDCFGEDSEIVSHYQEFKVEFIAKLPRDCGWIISEESIREWSKKFEKEK